MQRLAHWTRGVRNPAHAWKLYARGPGDPANWPCRVAPRGPRRESEEYDGDERLREVGHPHSTCEAFEVGLWCAVACGEKRKGSGLNGLLPKSNCVAFCYYITS